MVFSGIVPVLGVLAASVAVAGAIIACLARIMRPAASAIPAPTTPPADIAAAVFLFHGGMLTDATPAARHLISAIRSDAPALNVVAGHLARRFPGLRERLRTVEERGEVIQTDSLPGRIGSETLLIESGHGFLRFTVDRGAAAPTADQARIATLEDELQTLRSVAEDAPQLIWQQDADARLIWANRAYLALSDRLSGRTDSDDPLWPSDPILPELRPLPDGSANVVTRVRVTIPGDANLHWYEVTSVRRGPTTVHFAMDASTVIAAEEGRQKFIQTLTKTFAHLSSGLAIFDRDRRLVLFNPAFLDLTTLPATFLSQRPPVSSVLDRLRDLQMLPEPKDYSSWRDRVAALEAAAVRGTYSEIWSLPSGRTYRVSGRPHPDGAIAFLFEDMSDEIFLTRQFRSELETAQSVLDTLDEAVGVFSRAGTLTMSNDAYADLWGRGATSLADIGLSGEITNWQAQAHPSPIWDRLRQSAAADRDRVRWLDDIHLSDGRSFTCRFQPLAGGSTLIGFRPQTAATPRLSPGDRAPRPRAVAQG
jgi:PAS domain-containing protein